MCTAISIQMAISWGYWLWYVRVAVCVCGQYEVGRNKEQTCVTVAPVFSMEYHIGDPARRDKSAPRLKKIRSVKKTTTTLCSISAIHNLL